MSEPAIGQNLRVVEHATCTFCGCVCDDMDLTVDLDAKRITKAKNACTLGRAWFAEHTIEDKPPARIDGKPATTAEAVEAAAQILARARLPIIYGLSDTTCEAQRQAVAIADLDAREHRHHHLGLPWPLGHRLPGRGREHRHPGRDQEPRGSGDLLGRQSGRIAPEALHALRRDPEGHVHPEWAQGPLRRPRRCAPHPERPGRGPLPPSQAGPGLRAALGPARLGEGPQNRSVDRRDDRHTARDPGDPGRAHEELPATGCCSSAWDSP